MPAMIELAANERLFTGDLTDRGNVGSVTHVAVHAFAAEEVRLGILHDPVEPSRSVWLSGEFVAERAACDRHD